MTLRIQSSLDGDLEAIVSEVIGSCLAVHRELGPGLLEGIYKRALLVELDHRGLSHETEKPVPVMFKGQAVSQQRLDLIVERQVIVELKAVERLGTIHIAQCLSYLRASKLRIALLVNFNVVLLRHGVRRIVL